MDNKSDEQFIIIQSVIESNKHYMKSNKEDSDDKMMNIVEDLKVMLTEITEQIKTLKYWTTQKDPPKPPEPNTVVTANRRAPPLEGRQSTEIGGIWNLKHEISSPKCCELLIKI